MKLEIKMLGQQPLPDEVKEAGKIIGMDTYEALEYTYTMNDYEMFQVLICMFKSIMPNIPGELIASIVMQGPPDDPKIQASLDNITRRIPFLGLTIQKRWEINAKAREEARKEKAMAT